MLKRILTSNALIYAVIFAMLGLFIAKNAFDIEVPMVAILMIAVLPAFVANPTQMMAMALSFIPFGTGFQYKYALMAYVLIGIVRFGSKMHLSRLTLPLIMLIIWEMLHVLVGPMDMNELMRGFAEFAFLWFVSCLNFKNIDAKVLTRALAIATIGVCCITMYMQTELVMGDVTDVMQKQNTIYRFGGAEMEEDESFGLSFNPNQLGFICNLAIAAIMILMRMRKSALIDIVMLCVCVAFGCFTLSRAFLVCLSFLVGGFVLLSSGDLKRRILHILLIGLLIGGVVWAIDAFLPDVIKNFVTRWEVNDITNNRSSLFEFYNNHITSTANHCFFGLGLQEFGEKLLHLYGPDTEVCHNGFQEVWVVWGLPGVALMGFWLWQFMAETKRWNPRKIFFSFVPFILTLLYIQSGQFIRSGTALLSLVLAFAVMSIPSRELQQ